MMRRLWTGMFVLVVLVGFPVVTLGKAWILDVLGWLEVEKLPTAWGDGVAFILDNTMYYAGGWTGDLNQHNGVVYGLILPSSTSNSGWTQISTLPGVTRFGAAAVTYREYAYILGGYGGGSILDRVDIINDTTQWVTGPALLEPLHFPAAVVANGYLYVAGGLQLSGNSIVSSNKVWRAEIDGSGMLVEWKSDNVLPLGLTTRLAANGLCLYAVGGRDGAGNPRDEIYAAAIDPVTGALSWSSDAVGQLPFSLALHAVTVQRGQLYVFGGEKSGGGYSNQVYYIELQDTTPCDVIGNWGSFSMPNDGGRQRVAVASRWGEIYMIGGQLANDSYTNQVWRLSLDAPEAELELTKSNTPDGPVGYGEMIAYTLNYYNPWENPEPQTEVYITDVVPEDTELVSATTSGFSQDGQILRWDIGSLASEASGAVTFTVRTKTPAYSWTLTSAQHSNYDISTMQGGVYVSYTVAYTPTGDLRSGLLFTHTLPAPLVPLTIQADARYIQFAVRGQDVIWRVLDDIKGAGHLTVTACISGSLQSTTPLTTTTVLYDAMNTTVISSAVPISTGADVTLGHSCHLPHSHIVQYKNTVASLYPDVSVSNQAWIYSKQLSMGQASNVVTNIWPGAWQIYLPLVTRRN
ncbi:MAG: DUF11 domain-containing protein [Anaerolineae bacterium]|nr:DUF11 domain-containing protein [Anaerolineae bacterium]